MEPDQLQIFFFFLHNLWAQRHVSFLEKSLAGACSDISTTQRKGGGIHSPQRRKTVGVIMNIGKKLILSKHLLTFFSSKGRLQVLGERQNAF